jgi:AbrB family looped-hinge helix DNA binding protein
MAVMSTTVTIDKAGRLIIPKALRDELRLEPGDRLAVEFDGNTVTMRPIRSESALRKKRGIWVFQGSRKMGPGDTDQALESLRRRRDREMLGVK